MLLPGPPVELAPLPYSTQSELLPNVTESGEVALTAVPVANTAVVKDAARNGEMSREDAPAIAMYVPTAIKSSLACFGNFSSDICGQGTSGVYFRLVKQS